MSICEPSKAFSSISKSSDNSFPIRRLLSHVHSMRTPLIYLAYKHDTNSLPTHSALSAAVLRQVGKQDSPVIPSSLNVCPPSPPPSWAHRSPLYNLVGPWSLCWASLASSINPDCRFPGYGVFVRRTCRLGLWARRPRGLGCCIRFSVVFCGARGRRGGRRGKSLRWGQRLRER